MTFNNTYKHVIELESASHAWIALHRLVEAYCRTVGSPFHSVFAELEERFAFDRSDPNRWPDLDTMRQAAQWLHEKRERVLAERGAYISKQRIAKAGGQREAAPSKLCEAEARVRLNAESIPKVGYWGWRKRRESDGT